MNSPDEGRGDLFLSTRDGREVDFGRVVGVKVKNSEQISDSYLAGVRELQAVTGEDFQCSVVQCNTRRGISYELDINLVLPHAFSFDMRSAKYYHFE